MNTTSRWTITPWENHINESIRNWLTAALPLLLTPSASESLTVPASPAVAPVLTEVSEAAPVLKKARQSAKTSGNKKALDKTSRRRSPFLTARWRDNRPN